MELENEDQKRRRAQKILTEHLNGLLSQSKKDHPDELFIKAEEAYKGVTSKSRWAINQNNQQNVILPTVETRATYILDNEVTLSVVPKIFNFTDMQKIRILKDLADIQDACMSHVLKINDFNNLKQKAVFNGEKFGAGIVKVFWDTELSHGRGDVHLEVVDNKDFFPDPSANCVEECNFIFVRKKYSTLTLKRMYPDLSEEIDKLPSIGSDNASNRGSAIKGVINYSNDTNSGQAFAYSEGAQVKKTRDIEVWEAYLKDDTTFQGKDFNDGGEKEIKNEIKEMYPNGRMVIYSHEMVFEDKPIDYPFGFPFAIYNSIETDTIWGKGIVEDLYQKQESINNAYNRVRDLIKKNVNIIGIKPTSGLNRNEMLNQTVVQLDQACAPGDSIQLIQSNTITGIDLLQDWVQMLKADVREISGLNEVSMGRRPTGTTSGKQLEILKESDFTRIRASQRNFVKMVRKIGEMILTLTALYYTVPRMIRLNSGKEFAYIPNREATPENEEMMNETADLENAQVGAEGAIPEMGTMDTMESQLQGVMAPAPEVLPEEPALEGEVLPNVPRETNVAVPSSIKIYDDLGNYIREIKGDLSVGEYEIEIITGSEMPRSRDEKAQLILQVGAMIQSGQMSDPDMAEMYLSAIDFPDWREIVGKMRDQQEQAMNMPPPPPSPPVDKMNLAFRDLPDWAKDQILQGWGLTPPPPEMMGLPGEVPGEMPIEGEAIEPEILGQTPVSDEFLYETDPETPVI